MRPTRGMTLIEVLAALVILGTAATSILVAQARAIEQAKVAALEVEAAAMANELIANWRLNEEKMADSASGRIDGQGEWSWRRTSERKELGAERSVMEVRLELTYLADSATWSRSYFWWEKQDAAP